MSYTDEEKQRLLDAILHGWCEDCELPGDDENHCPACERVLEVER
jgi:hypothetical protein